MSQRPPRGRAVLVLRLLLFGLTLASGSVARADERDLRLLETPATYTDVADAADGRDPFDLNVRVLFRRVQEWADVRRR